MLYSVQIADEMSQPIGQFEVWQGVEPADAMYNFASRHNLTFTKRQQLLRSVCNAGRVAIRCTRASALLYTQSITDANGRVSNQLPVYEDDNPLDLVYTFCKDNCCLNKPTRKVLTDTMCGISGVNCTRSTPREVAFDLTVTIGGVPHKLKYPRPSPEDEMICKKKRPQGTHCVHHVDVFSSDWCQQWAPQWSDCKYEIMKALHNEMKRVEIDRWESKDRYSHLRSLWDADNSTIHHRYLELLNQYPNATEPEKHKKIVEAWKTLGDGEKRATYVFDNHDNSNDNNNTYSGTTNIINNNNR